MSPTLDEHDLALLHALQIAPRGNWVDLARILGATPTTLASRWARLRSTGRAWVTVHPARRLTNVLVSFTELDVEPSRRAEAVERLCADPRAVTVEETANGCDLIVTSMVNDHDELTRFRLDVLPRIPGVQRLNTYVATQVHWEGSRWRLDALDAAQQAELNRIVRNETNAAPATVPDAYWPLIEGLTHDGRRSAADLARITGRHEATVRRQLGKLLSTDLLSFRCEVAQIRSRWPLVCTWFVAVPQAELERTIRSLTTLPELRMCFSVAGTEQLVFQAMAHSPEELMRLERGFAEKLPWMTLVKSILTLRMPKRMGWILDEEGKSTGEVVVPSTTHSFMPEVNETS